jgi:Site-specific recombinase
LAAAQHPAGHRLGRDRRARWGEALARNAADWATNVSLGFMLGMTPAIGHLLGAPLDVRHVTLNSGVLSLASASLGRCWFSEGMFLRGIAGVAVRFVLNLSVSFLLALMTAARAYELPPEGVRAPLRGLYRRFVTAPRRPAAAAPRPAAAVAARDRRPLTPRFPVRREPSAQPGDGRLIWEPGRRKMLLWNGLSTRRGPSSRLPNGTFDSRLP